MGENIIKKERRGFLRYEFQRPLRFQVIRSSDKKNPVSMFMEAVSKNLSASGILFHSHRVPAISSFLVLNLDYRTAAICREIENNALIINNKLLGKVVRIEDTDDGNFDIGVAFVKKDENLAPSIRELL